MLMLGWMSQMQFQIPDNEIFFAYLGRYITKYEGRGLPTPLDESLLAQVHRTVTKPSATIAKELAAANARSSKLESEVSDLKVQLQQVLLASGGHFANDRFYGKCHWCGQKGHASRERLPGQSPRRRAYLTSLARPARTFARGCGLRN